MRAMIVEGDVERDAELEQNETKLEAEHEK
jgi:hypothetical protein